MYKEHHECKERQEQAASAAEQPCEDAEQGRSEERRGTAAQQRAAQGEQGAQDKQGEPSAREHSGTEHRTRGQRSDEHPRATWYAHTAAKSDAASTHSCSFSHTFSHNYTLFSHTLMLMFTFTHCVHKHSLMFLNWTLDAAFQHGNSVCAECVIVLPHTLNNTHHNAKRYSSIRLFARHSFTRSSLHLYTLNTHIHTYTCIHTHTHTHTTSKQTRTNTNIRHHTERLRDTTLAALTEHIERRIDDFRRRAMEVREQLAQQQQQQ